MREALTTYLQLAGGVREVTVQRALGAARALVAQGEATAEQVSALAEDVVAQSRANREAVTALVSYEVDRTLGRLGLASAQDVGQLADRVTALEGELRALHRQLAHDGVPGAGLLSGGPVPGGPGG